MHLKKLKIPHTKNTPEFIFDPNGFIKIRGRSMKPHLDDLAELIVPWIDNYILNPAEVTCIDFYLEYLNTSNVKFYTTLLKKLLPIDLKNRKDIINWYYEEGDEDIFEKGGYISSALQIQFNFIMVGSPNNSNGN